MQAAFAATGAFALDAGSKDAALLVTLPPGPYSATIAGADRGTGEALVEIYEVPQNGAALGVPTPVVTALMMAIWQNPHLDRH